jgi:hypothetical protein
MTKCLDYGSFRELNTQIDYLQNNSGDVPSYLGYLGGENSEIPKFCNCNSIFGVNKFYLFQGNSG